MTEGIGVEERGDPEGRRARTGEVSTGVDEIEARDGRATLTGPDILCVSLAHR